MAERKSLSEALADGPTDDEASSPKCDDIVTNFVAEKGMCVEMCGQVKFEFVLDSASLQPSHVTDVRLQLSPVKTVVTISVKYALIVNTGFIPFVFFCTGLA